jgi:magnesium-dependent phosphatase 1
MRRRVIHWLDSLWQLFFDDERRNKEVESLGVTFQLISHSGLTKKTFDQGVALWRKHHPETEWHS